MISPETIQAIQESVKTETIEIGGVVYTTRPIHDIRKSDPEPKALEIHTLKGLIDYVNGCIDGAQSYKAFAHIVNHAEVRLNSEIFGRFQQRAFYVVAKFEDLFGKSFQFGVQYDRETFNVALQSLFLQTLERDALLSLVGNIKEEAVKQTADDGITQSVTAKSGIAMVKEVAAPNPVTLRPFRTFREIEQPESKFVFRMRNDQGKGLTCALFEADGGAWKLTAMNSIREYIDANCHAVSIIG
jgi:hypothetical protein